LRKKRKRKKKRGGRRQEMTLRGSFVRKGRRRKKGGEGGGIAIRSWPDSRQKKGKRKQKAGRGGRRTRRSCGCVGGLLLVSYEFEWRGKKGKGNGREKGGDPFRRLDSLDNIFLPLEKRGLSNRGEEGKILD